MRSASGHSVSEERGGYNRGKRDDGVRGEGDAGFGGQEGCQGGRGRGGREVRALRHDRLAYEIITSHENPLGFAGELATWPPFGKGRRSLIPSHTHSLTHTHSLSLSPPPWPPPLVAFPRSLTLAARIRRTFKFLPLASSTSRASGFLGLLDLLLPSPAPLPSPPSTPGRTPATDSTHRRSYSAAIIRLLGGDGREPTYI
jgi:hypothetical protein